MNEILAIIALAGYGMIVRDIRQYLSTKRKKPQKPQAIPLPYPMPAINKRRRGPWS